MAKKSQAVTVLEGRLNLLKTGEEKARREFETAMAQRATVEDLLESIRKASAGAKGGKSKERQARMRQAVVKNFNNQAAEAAARVNKAKVLVDAAKTEEAKAVDLRQG